MRAFAAHLLDPSFPEAGHALFLASDGRPPPEFPEAMERYWSGGPKEGLSPLLNDALALAAARRSSLLPQDRLDALSHVLSSSLVAFPYASGKPIVMAADSVTAVTLTWAAVYTAARLDVPAQQRVFDLALLAADRRSREKFRYESAGFEAAMELLVRWVAQRPYDAEAVALLREHLDALVDRGLVNLLGETLYRLAAAQADLSAATLLQCNRALFRAIERGDPPPMTYDTLRSSWCIMAGFRGIDAAWGRQLADVDGGRLLIRSDALSIDELRVLQDLNAGDETDSIPILGGTLLKRDVRSINPGKWVNDEAITAMGTLVKERAKGTVHVFSSFLLPVLMSKGYDYSRVKKWGNAVPQGANLFFFPINAGEVHWALAVADLRERTLTYYDSLSNGNEAAVESLVRYLGDAGWGTYWVRVSPGKATPQQPNNYDCGAYVMATMNVLSATLHRGLTVDLNHVFQAEDIARIRQQAQLDILRHRLYPD